MLDRNMDHQLPPKPDISHKPSFSSQKIIEIIYSSSNYARGIITIDSKGLYRVRTEFWDVGDWESTGAAFWNEDHIGTLIDTLENAQKLCRECLLTNSHR